MEEDEKCILCGKNEHLCETEINREGKKGHVWIWICNECSEIISDDGVLEEIKKVVKREKERKGNSKDGEVKEKIYCCRLCDELINRRQASVECTQCKEWIHLKCSKFETYKEAKENKDNYVCNKCEKGNNVTKNNGNENDSKDQDVGDSERKSKEKIIENETVKLYECDVETLMEGKWINDNVVAFAFNEMQKMHDSKLKNIVFVRPAMTHMIKVSNDENDIKMIIEDLGLRKADYAFFPVNNNLSEKEGGSHWSLMIFSRKENTFYHLDPISGMNDGSVALLIKKLIDINTKFPEVKYVMCPRQRNGYDCGPYTLMFAEKIAENIEAGTELTKIGECNAREYRMKLRKVIEERSKDKCEKSNRNKKQEMGEKSIENKVQTSHVKDFKEQKKVEKKRECWHFTNRTCKFGDQCRDEHKKHCQEMIENGYCFDNECRLGHPIICREIYETGSCKRFICRHFHPINLRNKNQKKQSNWRHETERPSNRRPRNFYQKKEIDNTKPHNEYNQWGYKRDHRNTFLENKNQNMIEAIEPLMVRAMEALAERIWNRYR